MALEQYTIFGRTCLLWIPEGTGPFPVAVLCGGNMEDQLLPLAKNHPSLLLVSPQADWERDYTPWTADAPSGRPPFTADAPSGRSPFTGGAPEFLDQLESHILPEIRHRFPVDNHPESTAIAGYSLGGLFALWTLCCSNTFGSALSLSGSLWYDGWPEFLSGHLPPRDAKVYLSLGKKEEKRGSIQMRTIGQRTQWTASQLTEYLGDDNVTFEWNPGGHFTDILGRWNRGLDWLDALTGPVKLAKRG